MLESRDEETVLVMYGDHLPGFSFTDEVLKNGDIYQTQYVVWSNFSLPSEKKIWKVISWQRMYSRCLACRKVI